MANAVVTGHSPTAPVLGQLPALTGLRFMLAMRVLTRHWVALHPAVLPFWLDGVVNRGAISVAGFFVLSGFVLAYRYMDEDRHGAMHAQSFWAQRIARLYPVYALGLLLALPMLVGFFLEEGATWFAAAKTGFVAATVLTLTQAWFPNAACVWNCQGWSLSATVFFLLLFPIVATAAIKWSPRRLMGAALVFWALALMAPFAFQIADFDSVAHEELAWNAVMWNPLLRLPEFLLGVAAGRIYQLRRKANLPSRLGHPLVGIGALASIVFMLSFDFGVPEVVLKSMSAPLLAILVYSLAANRGPLAKLLSTRPLQIFGAASFALYILHTSVSEVTIPVGRWVGLDPGTSIALFAIDIALSVALAVWVSRKFEGPASAWLKKRIPARWAPPPRVPALPPPNPSSV